MALDPDVSAAGDSRADRETDEEQGQRERSYVTEAAAVLVEEAEKFDED